MLAFIAVRGIAPLALDVLILGAGGLPTGAGVCGGERLPYTLALHRGGPDGENPHAGIVRLIRLDPKNLQSRTIRLQVDATRPGRRLGLV